VQADVVRRGDVQQGNASILGSCLHSSKTLLVAAYIEDSHSDDDGHE
jgi:hypothetical protein